QFELRRDPAPESEISTLYHAIDGDRKAFRRPVRCRCKRQVSRGGASDDDDVGILRESRHVEQGEWAREYARRKDLDERYRQCRHENAQCHRNAFLENLWRREHLIAVTGVIEIPLPS